jgi:serine/threonine protein kinase
MTDPTSPLAPRLAEALGNAYTIEGEIGRGGMGVVYRARDERLKRRVAIKVLPPELAFQQEIRARFTREAETAARLSHPHIVPIHSVGEGNGLVYFVMGYVDGESLGARLKRRGRLPVEEARRIMKETADALSAAHAMSVIHRDIKPDNILLEGTRGRVMVTDFGIAKAMSGSGGTLTSAGVAIGTPQYMSPEQAAGEKEIDGRSDLYSLGIVSYQMLTGELPFNAPTVAGILMKQIGEMPEPIKTLRTEVPEDLDLAVTRCLEKDPRADGLRPMPPSRAREPDGDRLPAYGPDEGASRVRALSVHPGRARAVRSLAKPRRHSPVRPGPATTGAPDSTGTLSGQAVAWSGGTTLRSRCPIPASRRSSRRPGPTSRAGPRSRQAASWST